MFGRVGLQSLVYIESVLKLSIDICSVSAVLLFSVQIDIPVVWWNTCSCTYDETIVVSFVLFYYLSKLYQIALKESSTAIFLFTFFLVTS